jgi:hypothetical protein
MNRFDQPAIWAVPPLLPYLAKALNNYRGPRVPSFQVNLDKRACATGRLRWLGTKPVLVTKPGSDSIPASGLWKRVAFFGRIVHARPLGMSSAFGMSARAARSAKTVSVRSADSFSATATLVNWFSATPPSRQARGFPPAMRAYASPNSSASVSIFAGSSSIPRPGWSGRWINPSTGLTGLRRKC